MPGLGYQKRLESAPFDRLSRGLLYTLPSVLAPIANNNPSVAVDIPIAIAARANVTIQSEISRAYLMRAGVYLTDGPNYIGVMSDNTTGASYGTSVNSVNGVQYTVSIHPENTFNFLKLDLNAGVMRRFAEGIFAAQDQRPVPGGMGLVTPFLRTNSDSVTQVNGNLYTSFYRNTIVCKNNTLTLFGFVPYGSVVLSINGAAPITINIDGNGDAVYDFGGTIFPCQGNFVAYDAPNGGGKRVGKFSILDLCGGDVLGGTHILLPAYPWTPKSVSRMTLWVKPESMIVAGGAPMNTGWPDASGLGRTLGKSGSAAPTKIDNVKNGLSVARFNGSGQVLFRDDVGLRQPNMTLLMALAWNAHAGTTGILSIMAGGSQGLNINDNAGAGAEGVLAGSAGAVNNATSVGASLAWHVLAIESNKLTGRLRVFLNNTPVPVVDQPNWVDWSTQSPPFCLGTFYADVGATGLFGYGNADVGEIIMYDKVLRTADRVALLAYLTARWL